MFRADLPTIDYRAPWTQPLEDRIAALTRPAERRVAYLYQAPDTSTFRYRVFNMVQALEGSADVAAAWFTVAEVPRLLPLLDRCDALVVCRVRYADAIGNLLNRARQLRVATVFDCDDLVFDPDYVHLILHTLDQQIFEKAWDTWFAMIGRIAATMRLCDRGIVTNDFLADRLRAAAPGKPVGVVPNFLERTQRDLSLRLYGAKQHSGFARDGRIHIGYFSGTPTHSRDFAIIADALARLMHDDPRIVLRLVGFVQPAGALAEFADRIEHFPLQDHLNLQRLIAGVEFNVAPLQSNDFTNCKSDLKYFEAASVGTLTLASPTHAFRAAISDGVNGWLVPAYDWHAALQAAIGALDVYPAMAARAFAHASAGYSPEAMSGRIRLALFGPPSAAAASPPPLRRTASGPVRPEPMLSESRIE